MKKHLLLLLMSVFAFGVGWAADTWQEAAASALSTGDIVVIVDKTSGMAMSNDKGTSAPPVATEVSFISNQTQISAPLEKIQWEVTVANGSYKFNVPGTSNYLYCTANNNGVRVGTNSNNSFTINNDSNGVPFLYNTATSRYLGVYNNQDWRCYTSINNNIKNCVLAFYKKIEPASNVATPVISGITPFAGSTQVTINCETNGASIYYTLDGSDPSTSSTLYIDLFTINATTTVKAIAALNAERSNIATKTFTAISSISSIAEFNALTEGTNFQYTASNLVYIVSNAAGNNHYVQDGSKGMLIYGSLGQTYNLGDVIPGGFTGTRAVYNTAPEMTNPNGFAASSENVELTPVELTPSQVNMDNFGRYAIIKNASFDASTKTITADGETIGYHTSLNSNIPTDGAIYDVIGVCGYYKPNNGDAYPQFLPISFTEVQTTGPEYYLAGNFNGWGDAVNSEVNKFTKRADGSYVLNKELADPTEDAGILFKIIKVDNGTTTWLGGGGETDPYNIHSGHHTDIQLVDGKNFHMSDGGICTFNISADEKLTLDKADQLFMKGSYDNWAAKTAMTATNAGWTVTMDMETGTEFGFVDEWGDWHGGAGTQVTMDTELAMGTNGNYIINAASNYTITANSELTTLVVTDNNAVVEGGYVKVTSTDDLTSGTYLIVYEDGPLAFNGGLETLDAVGNSIAVTISNDIIPSSTEVDAAAFTYDASAGTLKSASGYYIGQTSDANGLASSATNAYINTVSIDADGNANIVSSGGAYLRYNAASNQTRFRYYKSSSYTGQKAIQLYKKIGEVAPTLPTPVISGESPFLGSTTVTISCEDTEAEVRYTLDGTDPTDESTLYEAPFIISETTTVKAKAFKGEAFSNVASKDFVEILSVATIAEYKELAEGTTFMFTGNVTVTYVNGKNLYVKDDSGSALIYGDNDFTDFVQGQVLAANWTATTTIYNGLLEAKNPSSLTATEQTVEVSPVEKSIDAVTTANDNEYIIVKNVTVSAVDNRNFTITDANNVTINGRTNFAGVEHPTNLDANYDITCVVGEYNGTVQLYPTEYNEATEVYSIILNVGPGGTAVADKAEASEGEGVDVTVIADPNYMLDDVTYSYTTDHEITGQLLPKEEGHYAFIMPAAAVTITVTFKKMDNHVKFDANPEGGTVAVKANDNAISSMDYVVEGADMVVEYTPAEGYELESLRVYRGLLNEDDDLGQAAAVDCSYGLQDGCYHFTMPASDVTIIAKFTQTQYDLEGVSFAADRSWATYYNGTCNLTLPDGMKAYVANDVIDDAVDITEINYIPAGVGVLLYYEGVANEITTNLYTGETGTYNSILVGSDAAMNITRGYVLYNNNFYLVEPGEMAAHRCYLPVPQAAGAPAKLSIGYNESIITAISDLMAEGNVAAIKYVNVNGQISSEPFDGINVAVVTFTDGTSRTVKVVK